MTSKQINSSPTLKQFATLFDGDELVVTSKLGGMTVSRVMFKQLDYPRTQYEREGFIRGLVLQHHPSAPFMLSQMFDICIKHQAEAASALLD